MTLPSVREGAQGMSNDTAVVILSLTPTPASGADIANQSENSASVLPGGLQNSSHQCCSQQPPLIGVGM